MSTLPTGTAQEIEQLRQAAVEASRAGDPRTAIGALNTAWDLLPEPRTAWDESFIITQYLVVLFLKSNDLEQAQAMAERLQACALQRQDIGEREFTLGRVQFERGDKEEAYRSFKVAHDKSEGRIWRLPAGKPYWEFFRSHR